MEEHSESKKLKLNDPDDVVEENVKLNPLLDPLVIDKVFESMANSLDDLKNFRLVCKSWHGETAKLWRKFATLKIIREKNDMNNTGRGMGMERFLQYWDADTYQFRTRPFVRFKLSGFGIDGVQSGKANSRFWKVIKDSMEHLRVESCAFGSKRFYRKLRTFLRMSKPNLRSFVLKDLKFRKLIHQWDEDGDDYFYGSTDYEDSDEEEENEGEDIPDPDDPEQQETDFGCGENLRSLEVTGKLKTASWKDVMKNSPTLERLKIGSLEQMTGITAAIAPGGGGQLSRLRHLRLGAPVYFEKEKLLQLLTWDPPLESLSIFIPYPNWRLPETNIGLGECLEKVSGTLRTLHLTCDDVWGQGIGDVRNDPFHGMTVTIPTLKELCMWGHLVGSMSFLKLFPNLEVLKINLSLFEKSEDLDRFHEEIRHNDAATEEFWEAQDNRKKAVDIVQLTQTELQMKNLTHFRYDFDKLSVESWRLLGTWMPNLSKLEAVLTNETVSIVCEQWPDLLEVECLFGSTVNDEGVVAMVKGQKSLGTLRIQYYCGYGKLTDACVSGGLLETGLSRLEILNCGKMSDDMKEKLKQKIPCVKLISCNNSAREKTDFECCERRKFDECYYLDSDDDDEDCDEEDEDSDES